MAYIGNNNLPFDPTRTAAQPRDAERFSGNGSTTNFTLTRTPPNGAVDVDVYVENVKQEPIVAYDVIGNSLNFTEAPPTGTYNIYVIYSNFQSGAQIIMPDGSVSYSKLANNLRLFTTDNLTANGSAVSFTLSEPPADANTVFVMVDGIVQRAPIHYTTSGSTITFTSAPPAGSNVHVRHLGFRTTATVTAVAANTTIPQPLIQTPIITGNTLAGPIRATEAYFGNTSSALNAYGPEYGYVANFQSVGAANSQTFISIAGAGQTPGSQGMIIGSDSTDGYITQRNDRRIILGTNNTNRFIVPGSSGNFQATSGASMLPAFFARAWVNFDGYTGGGTGITGSSNVTSITRNSTGNYNVNFTTNMPDANYCCVASTEALYSTYTYACPYNYYTYAINVLTVTPTPALINSRATNVVIYR